MKPGDNGPLTLLIETMHENYIGSLILFPFFLHGVFLYMFFLGLLVFGVLHLFLLFDFTLWSSNE